MFVRLVNVLVLEGKYFEWNPSRNLFLLFLQLNILTLKMTYQCAPYNVDTLLIYAYKTLFFYIKYFESLFIFIMFDFDVKKIISDVSLYMICTFWSIAKTNILCEHLLFNFCLPKHVWLKKKKILLQYDEYFTYIFTKNN